MRRLFPQTTRGQILWLFGWAFVIVGGLNYIGTTIPQPTRLYLAAVLDHAPAWLIGILFISVGLVDLVSSYLRFDRDRWGYVLSAMLAGTWGTVYVCGWLFYDAPVRAIGGSIVWLLYAAILTTCARVPRLPDSLERRR